MLNCFFTHSISAVLTEMGYSDLDSVKSIEIMVRERLLECVNVPTEMDYTSKYELDKFHSFRCSPLGVTLFKEISTEVAYLTMCSYDMPIYEESYYQHVLHEYQAISELFCEDVNYENISLIKESSISTKIIEYLIEMYEYEKLLGKNYKREILEIEKFVDDCIISKLKSKIESSRRIKKLPLTDQVELSFMDNNDRFDPKEYIPKGILEMKLDNYHHAHKIFWALVILKIKGYNKVQGMKITEIINGYLLEQNMPSNNISRTLRSMAKKGYDWLICDSNGANTLYYLNDDWEVQWSIFFLDTPAPNNLTS